MIGFERGDEKALAGAILDGAKRRPRQLFGAYFEGTGQSDAFGAAYEGIYRLPVDATGIRPKGIYRFFECLDDSVRRCPAECPKRMLLESLLIHLNDDHHWTRERIALWLKGVAGPAEGAARS